jgi:hypothetical protein
MERTALRLATVATLINGGHGPPWPTVAGEFVYDSMIDSVVDVVPSKRRPVIIIRVDDDNLAFNRFQIIGRQARLLIEFGVLSAATTLINGKEEPRIDWPRTDSSLEAFLDLLEWQIWAALRGHGYWASLYQDRWHYGQFSGYSSVPRFSAPERGAVRLAVRTLSILVNLPPECPPSPVKEFAHPVPDVLPEGWVRVVNDLLCTATGDFKKSIEQLAAIIEAHGYLPRPTYPPLQRVWASIPSLEIEAMWPIEQEAPFVETANVMVPPETGTPAIDHAG